MVIRYFRSQTCFIQSDLVIKMGKCIFVLYLYCDAITLLCGLPKSLVKIFCNFLSIAKQLSGEGKKAPLCFTLLMAMSKKSKAFFSVWKIWIQLMKNVFFISFIFLPWYKILVWVCTFSTGIEPNLAWKMISPHAFSLFNQSWILHYTKLPNKRAWSIS